MLVESCLGASLLPQENHNIPDRHGVLRIIFQHHVVDNLKNRLLDKLMSRTDHRDGALVLTSSTFFHAPETRHKLVPSSRIIEFPIGGDKGHAIDLSTNVNVVGFTSNTQHVCTSLFGSARLCFDRQVVVHPAKTAQGTIKGTPVPIHGGLLHAIGCFHDHFSTTRATGIPAPLRELGVLLLVLVAGLEVLNETDTVPAGNQRSAVPAVFTPRFAEQRDF